MNALTIAAFSLHALLVIALATLLVVATTLLLNARKPLEARIQK